MSFDRGIEAISNAASTAAQTVTIETHKRNELWVAIRMLATGDPAGTIVFTGSINGTNFAPLNIVQGTIGGLATGVTWDSGTPQTITLADPPAAVSLLLGFDSPPPFVKVTWTPTGGSGTATGFYLDYFKRDR